MIKQYDCCGLIWIKRIKEYSRLKHKSNIKPKIKPDV